MSLARPPLRPQPSVIQGIRAKHSWHDALRTVRRVFNFLYEKKLRSSCPIFRKKRVL